MSGNNLVNGQGQVIRLLGVNRPGMDVLGSDGSCNDFSSSDSPDNLQTMATWHIDAVRIPLNEDCWLGINGVDPTTTAPAYRAALQAYVSTMNQLGMYAVLDLHRMAPGTVPSTDMQAMPDADHAPAFWSSVASAFKSDPAVLFDLANEPHPDNVLPAGADAWACWLSGCTIPTLYVDDEPTSSPYQAAGMQQLVDAVRSTGATQPIMLEGLSYANWVQGITMPTDPVNQLVISTHVYSYGLGCVDLSCWDSQYVPLAQLYPIVTGEFGEDDCSDSFINQYMQFADANGISYLGWSWSLQTDCSSPGGFSLITAWNGTPSQEGAGLQSHLAALAG